MSAEQPSVETQLRDIFAEIAALKARAQKAEAVVEAARELRERGWLDGMQPLEDALTAYDEPPTEWKPQEC